MRRALITTALTLSLMATACGPPEPGPEPAPDPSEALCGSITTERECFDVGCSFFASANPLVADADVCEAGSAFGVCLFSADPDGPPTLTYYTQQRGDEFVAVQLGFEVTLEGWSSCPAATIDEVCACAP